MSGEHQQEFTPIQVLTTGFGLVDATTGAAKHGKLGGFRLADLRATFSRIHHQFETFDCLLQRLEVQYPDYSLLLELELAPAELEGILRLATWATTLQAAEEIHVVDRAAES